MLIFSFCRSWFSKLSKFFLCTMSTCCHDIKTKNRNDPSDKESLLLPLSASPINSDGEEPEQTYGLGRKWPTRWYWQFLVLTVRTFRRARRTILSLLRLIQTIFLAVICSLLWFQIPFEENHIYDRLGYVSYVVI